VTAQTTGCPATGAPLTSVTFTDGAVATAVLTTALCRSPATFWIAAAAPAEAVDVNVTVSLRPATHAFADCEPTTVPSVCVAAAMPDVLVAPDAGCMLPAPLTTAQLTVMLRTGFPKMSATFTR
jgi:hypothetical protein